MRNPLITIRPMLRIAKALEEIARALNYFAIADARENHRIYMAKPQSRWLKDESELLHTDSDAIAKLRQQDMELVLQRGYAALEANEDVET